MGSARSRGHDTTRRGRLWAAGAVALLAGASALLVASVATAAADKSFSVTPSVAVAPPADADAAAEIWAGATSRVTFVVTNASTSPQSLGSVDLTLPAGLVPVAGTVSGPGTLAGSVLRLRDLGLAPGASATVAVDLRVEDCTDAGPDLVVGTAAKQSNDFNGEGNDFGLTGPAPALDAAGDCTLAFTVQPASAQRSTDITSEVYLPFGGLTPQPAPVTVAVRDASPAAAPVAWWSTAVTLTALPSVAGTTALGGYVTAVPQAGVAVFRSAGATPTGPRLATSAPAYRLSASSAGLAAASLPSSAFDIVDVGTRCRGGQSCPGESSAPRSRARVDAVATSDGDLLRLSLGALGTPAPVCAAYPYAPSTDTLDFDLTTAAGVSTGGQRTIVFTLLAPYVTRAASKYDACFESTIPFTVRGGGTSTPSGGGFHTGLLPDCDRRSPQAPCEVGTTRARNGDIVMTLIAPAADPRARF